MLAFDCTYLQSGLQQMVLKNEHILVGGVYSPSNPEHCKLPFDHDVNIKSINKALHVLQFLTWDPCSPKKVPLSMAEIPVEHAWKGPGAGQRGGLYFLEIVGNVLQASGSVIQALVFDGATAHSLVRRALAGDDKLLREGILESIPWFNRLTFKRPPASSLPRMPLKLAYIDGECFFSLPAVCALPKLYIYLVLHIYIYMT